MAKHTATPKKAARKSAPAKKPGQPKPTAKPGKIDRVVVRMYCLGTGDCFILKCMSGTREVCTIMIDCGSCQGGPAEFQPYLDDLVSYVGNKVDLLIITHEHNDHVDGFAKCAAVFEKLNIGEAWFAWTENPDDPDGAAKELQKKRAKMRLAFRNALTAMKQHTQQLQQSRKNDFYKGALIEGNNAFISGLETLAEINLPAAGEGGNSLPGMKKIKEILNKKKVHIKYLTPGQTVNLTKAPGLLFHVLGPPKDREFIFKDGKEGTDVYRKKLALNESSLAATAFINMNDDPGKDLPFSEEFLVNGTRIEDPERKKQIDNSSQLYNEPDNSWRRIDQDWLNSAGSLALRLDSHINNTSLALALEQEDSKKVILFPGDAEYGNWESWHLIKKWDKKEANGKPFVEDLLNRTVFYKVGHHLSYNGTALEKGIMMMESPELAAMATLDRKRIAKGWKSTMPNKFLMQELVKRCGGKVFIMNEFEIKDGPASQFDFSSLGKDVYQEFPDGDNKNKLWKQYVVPLDK